MKRLTAFAAAALLAVATPAVALPNFGARAGFSSGPDQIHLGAHAEVLELSPGLVFLPSVEVGLGDNQTRWALNGELAWTVDSTEWRRWQSPRRAGPPMISPGAGGWRAIRAIRDITG